MRDIPMFTTENGAASLILREIPYTAVAYVRIQSSLRLPSLVEDCAAVCKAAGAERVYATGHEELEKYPLHTSILQMRCRRETLPETDACLLPVTKDTLEDWRRLYNRRMSGVDNAAWLTMDGAKEMLQKKDGYFVQDGTQLLGIGRASGGQIDAVISAAAGQGKQVLLALCGALCEDEVELTVASTNIRALKLYASLGFCRVRELSRWYRV